MANLKRINSYMNVGTYTDFERIENYIELFRAIVDGVYDLNGLFDYQEEKKRVAELDAMYARGELPPLAIEFKKSTRGRKSSDRVKKEKVGRGNTNCKGVRLFDLEEDKTYVFKTKKELEAFLNNEVEEKIYLKKINLAIANKVALLDRYRIEEIKE